MIILATPQTNARENCIKTNMFRKNNLSKQNTHSLLRYKADMIVKRR